jgi:hypothetical protein
MFHFQLNKTKVWNMKIQEENIEVVNDERMVFNVGNVTLVNNFISSLTTSAALFISLGL